MPEEPHSSLLSVWTSSHWLQLVECNHTANSLCIWWMDPRLAVSPVHRQGCCAGQCWTLCTSPGRWGLTLSLSSNVATSSQKATGFGRHHLSLLKPYQLSLVTFLFSKCIPPGGSTPLSYQAARWDWQPVYIVNGIEAKQRSPVKSCWLGRLLQEKAQTSQLTNFHFCQQFWHFKITQFRTEPVTETTANSLQFF